MPKIYFNIFITEGQKKYQILVQNKENWKLLIESCIGQACFVPGQKCYPTDRYFRSGRVIRLLAIQGKFIPTF